MSTDNINKLKAIENAIVSLSYPTTGKCSDVWAFCDTIRQIGSAIVTVRESLEFEAKRGETDPADPMENGGEYGDGNNGNDG